MNALPLRDIHLPDAVSWWPPAIGWWLLPLLLVALFFFARWLYKRLRFVPLNKRVQIEFKHIQQAFNQHQDPQQLAADISVLLRRTCISYKNRRDTASLTGEAWLQTLNTLSSVKFPDSTAKTLLSAPYRPQADINSDELLSACNAWINALPKQQGTAK